MSKSDRGAWTGIRIRWCTKYDLSRLADHHKLGTAEVVEVMVRAGLEEAGLTPTPMQGGVVGAGRWYRRRDTDGTRNQGTKGQEESPDQSPPSGPAPQDG